MCETRRGIFQLTHYYMTSQINQNLRHAQQHLVLVQDEELI